MLTMLIALDEERMERDVMDVSLKWAEIDRIVNGIKEIKQVSRGIFATLDSGAVR